VEPENIQNIEQVAKNIEDDIEGVKAMTSKDILRQINSFVDQISLFTIGIAAISAIVFPYRKKEIFEASPVNFRLGGIPVMSIIGLANTIFFLT
jgi:hypothetical protein